VTSRPAAAQHVRGLALLRPRLRPDRPGVRAAVGQLRRSRADPAANLIRMEGRCKPGVFAMITGPAGKRNGLMEHSEFRRSNQSARELFRPLPKHYDLFAELLSFGQNRRWRRRMVDEVAVGAPMTILDVATGTAGVARQMAARTDAYVIGVDITEEMVRLASRKVARTGLEGRIQLLLSAGERLPFRDSSFDALAFTYLLRYVPGPGQMLRELARVIRPGGRMVSLEFLVPPNRFWRFWWCLYTRTLLPVAGGLGGRAWIDVGSFLGPSISEHYRRYPLAWHVDAWKQAGMEDVGFSMMSLGGGLVMWGTKRGG
jgi:demethylmenaquinone methyltransferase/2-methoxy-6-polyprenyl-1,4-benzoquinol methylase